MRPNLLRRIYDALVRRYVRAPFFDERGRKPFWEWARAQPHVVHRLSLELAGWPRWPRPLRIAFLSDFHVGSHAADVARLGLIVAEAAAHRADLVLLGGDYVNRMLLGGGRVPPATIAAALGRLKAPLGCFAILGNHDTAYGSGAVREALRAQGIRVLEDEAAQLRFEGEGFELLGIPDARKTSAEAKRVLAELPPDRPALVLAHDPAWFARLRPGPYLMLAGHTHGGQIVLPWVGPIVNMSAAPLRWTHGLIREDGRTLYVTAGLGTSGIPLRIGVPPEYAVIELNGKIKTDG